MLYQSLLIFVSLVAGESCLHPKVTLLQDQFIKILRIHLSQAELIAKLTDILAWLPSLHSVASVLLQSKMLYVPFLLCRESNATNDEHCQINDTNPSSTSDNLSNSTE